MQLFLSFAQNPSSEPDESPVVWPTLESEQQNQALDVLARLLAKAAINPATKSATLKQKEISDE